MSFQHILAAVDDSIPPNAVIKKSVVLARKCQASLTILKVKRTHNFNLNLLLHRDKPRNKINGSRKPILAYPDRNQPIEIKECQSHSIHNAVVNECKQLKYDLVIVSHKFYPPFFNEFLIADEWQLLKLDDIPVMFVDLEDWHENGHILTALEIDNENLSHQKFNETLIEESKSIANLLANDLHLINSYLPDPFYMSFHHHQPHKLLTEREKYKEKLNEVARGYHLDPRNLHVEEGLPEDTISDEAKRLNVNMLVMGSAEHKGILSTFKGNAARNLINQLRTDLFIVKPKVHH
ncbi:universal stress protein [Shewanella acanthi]|uniref:universal stress protein n=1 Tax=Shewanella acanthi TaxID=2864212 RepID=UPI001C65654F|nr:universal stress protein [Shewanella acanthi]QYJ79728.1 universal stress protein [Shewanella acanthi]